MRGDCESKCLEIIRNAVLYKDGQLMKDPFSHKSYLDMSDDELKDDKNIIWIVNPDCYKSYFGLLESDIAEFVNILIKAKANPDLSTFPDFIFNNGFIEHFRITSSSVTRKGSTHAKMESEFLRTVNTEERKTESEWNENPSFDKICRKCWTMENPTHNYDFLIESFKRNWEHHLESCKKYTGSKEIGIFMIEYPEIALSMIENVYADWINGMSNGDMRGDEHFNEYRLSRDKNLLKYVYQFKDKIQYVIFLNNMRFEVIRTENIPYLMKLLPWDYKIASMYCKNVIRSYRGRTNISVNLEKCEEDEQT